MGFALMSFRADSEDTMTSRDARREAVSVWLMEFSVLWAVFPLLDQLVDNQPIDLRIMTWSLGISLTTLVIGVILRRGEER
jgi:hypothetical protein